MDSGDEDQGAAWHRPAESRTPQNRKYLAILQRDYPKFLTTNKRVSGPLPVSANRSPHSKKCLT